MGLDKHTLYQKITICHRTSTYPTTGLIPIVTQAIAKERRKAETIRQQELDLGGPGAIAESNSALLRESWVRDLHCPHRQGSTSTRQDVFL